MLKRTFIYLSVITVLMTVLSYGNSLYAAEEITAPGGEVRSYDELVTALGGENAVTKKKDSVLIKSDIRIKAPIVILEGDYTVTGAGASIFSGMTEGSLFVIGDGVKKCSLTMGLSDSNEESLVIDGEGKTLSSSFIKVTPFSELFLQSGTVICDAVFASKGAIENQGTAVNYSAELTELLSVESGGAIYNSGVLLLGGGKISLCSAENGGAVYNTGKLELIGTEIDSCSATLGGAVFSNGELNIKSSSLSKCKAESGGAVYNTKNAELSGGQIINCTSSENGGAVCNLGKLTLSGTYIKECSAENGGALYNFADTDITQSTVYECQAQKNGGAVYNDKDGTLKYAGGSLIWCSAVNGGAVYNKGMFKLSGGSISGNKAEMGKAVLNCGEMKLSEYAYVDGGNDIFILDGHALDITTPLHANTIATLTFGVSDGDGFKEEHSEGAVLLEGEHLKGEYKKFSVKENGDGEFLITAEGKTKEKTPVYLNPLFYISCILLWVLSVTLVVFSVRYLDKRKQGKDAL